MDVLFSLTELRKFVGHKPPKEQVEIIWSSLKETEKALKIISSGQLKKPDEEKVRVR